MDLVRLATTKKPSLIDPPVDDLPLSSKVLPTESPKNPGVATLQPFIPGPLPQRNRRNNRTNPKFLGSEFEVLPGLFEPTSYSRYLTMKFDDQRAEDSDMFQICREISTICGREPKMSFQNDGSVLIEAASPEESEKLQSMEIITGIKASCSPHKSMNRCKGVVRSRHLMKYSVERLQEEFKDQRVIDVIQVKRTIDGKLTPLPTYILTFDLWRLPRELKAAWLRLEIRPYVPSPRRCFYCQRFGHVSDSCRRKLKDEKEICSNCGKEEHGVCDRPSYCVNCSGSHPATSKSCDRYLLEREIQTIRAKERVTFQEAKKRVMTQFIRPGVSYASVINNTKKTPMPVKLVSSHVAQNNASLKDTSSTTNIKRRRSIEEQDISPYCKSNRFESLIDEVEDNLLDVEPMKLGVDSSFPGQDVTHALTRTEVRAEVHVSACSAEQADASASAGLESAVALSSADLKESVEEFSSGGLEEPPGAESLPVLGESVGSLERVGDCGGNVHTGVRSEKHQNTSKTPRKGKIDSTKATEEMSNRRIKIPRNKLGVTKPSTKTDIKSSPGRPPLKGSSRSHK